MKFSLIIVFLLLGFFNVRSQDSLLGGIFPLKNGEITYADEVSMDNLNKDEIFAIVREWAKTVYPYRRRWDEDKESQTFKGNVPFFDTSQGGFRVFRIIYSIKFFIRDEALEIAITDLQLEYSSFLYNVHATHKFEELVSPTRYVLQKKEKQNINSNSKADPNHINDFMVSMLKSIGRHLVENKEYWLPEIRMERL